MNLKTQITIRTKCDTTSWDFGRQFMEVLLDQGSKLLPEQVAVGTVNSFRNKIHFEELDACENYWVRHYTYRFEGNYLEGYDDFLWRRRKAVKTDSVKIEYEINGVPFEKKFNNQAGQ